MSGPLEGTRVIALAGMGPVPFLSMLLADLGADVIRIVRPLHRTARALAQTEGLSDAADVLNRGIESVPVDLKDPSGVEQVLGLVTHADVFLEGFRPGVVERLGLGPEEALARNTRLVYGRLTGYGQTGPRSGEAGHDINYVAQTGALRAMARHRESPRPPLNLLGDYGAGGALGAFGIVSAMFSAVRTGKGQVVDVGMADGVALLTAKLQSLRAAGILLEEPGTSFLDSGAPFYDVYRCADGGYIAVGAIEEDFYAAFVSRLGGDQSTWPEQNDQSRWPELRERIAERMSKRSRSEWQGIYSGTDACVTAVLSFEEAAADPHNVTRGMYSRIGGVLHPAPSPRFTATPAREPSRPASGVTSIASLESRWSEPRS